MKTMSYIIRYSIAVLILFVFVEAADASIPKDPAQYFFEQSMGDLSEELQIAREEGKKGIFMFFELTECPFCHRMKKTVLNQPEVQALFKKNFRSLAMDIEGDVEIVDFKGHETTQKAFSRKARVRATPVMAFYDLDGNMVVRYTGATSGPQEFMWLAEYYLKGIYKMKDKNGRRIRFGKYKRLKKQHKTIQSLVGS